MPSKHERHYGLGMDALTVCSRNTNVIIVWAWTPERSPTALCCPAEKHCEYGHKIASGSLASARNPTPVSKIELLQPPQNRAVTPGWREEPVSLGCATRQTSNVNNRLSETDVVIFLKDHIPSQAWTFKTGLTAYFLIIGFWVAGTSRSFPSVRKKLLCRKVDHTMRRLQ